MASDNALDDGAAFARGLSADERKSAAYNALSKTYGVALAGDPDTALKDQEYVQKDKLNPIAVQQAGANLEQTGLQNTGISQSNDYNALANPKKLAGLDLTNENTEATTDQTRTQTKRTNALLPGEVAQQGATLQQTHAQTGLTNAETGRANAETAQSKFSLNTAEAAQLRTSAMGILAGLSDTASTGGDMGAAFDKVAPLIAKYENVDPAHLPELRKQLVADPVGTINRLSSAIQAANLTAMGGGKGASGMLAMMKFSQGQMNLKDGLNFTRQRIAAVPEITQQALDLLPQMSTLATVRKAKAQIPGTAEYNFNALMHQVKDNLSLDDLRSLREGGLSLGKTNLAEFVSSANAIANTDVGLDPAMLKGNLTRVQNTYRSTVGALDAQISRLGSGGAGGVGKVTAPVPQGTTPQQIVDELRRRGAVK